MAANRVILKHGNKKTVLRAMMRASSATIGDVAARTGLTFATVSHHVADLQTAGLIRPMGVMSSSGGRKPVAYAANPDGRLFIAIEVRVQSIVVAIMDWQGQLRDALTQSFPHGHAPEDALTFAQHAVNTLVARNSWDSGKIGGVGVSIPGGVHYDDGLVGTPPNMPHWRNVPFQRMVQDAWEVPVQIDKSAYAAAYGELHHGVAQGVQNLLSVMVDAGIGTGLVLNGQIFRGAHGGAGEMGHMFMGGSARCNCGQTGCLETVASGLAILDRLHDAGQSQTLDHLMAHTHRADSVEAPIFCQAGAALGVAVANLCDVINPDMVVIGGGIGALEDYFTSVRQTARDHMVQEYAHRVRIEQTQLQGLAGVMGAGAMARQAFIEDIEGIADQTETSN